MAEEETKIYHIHLNQKYKIKFIKAAGVKTGEGFEVEVNGDLLDIVKSEADELLKYAQQKTELTIGQGVASNG